MNKSLNNPMHWYTPSWVRWAQQGLSLMTLVHQHKCCVSQRHLRVAVTWKGNPSVHDYIGHTLCLGRAYGLSTQWKEKWKIVLLGKYATLAGSDWIIDSHFQETLLTLEFCSSTGSYFVCGCVCTCAHTFLSVCTHIHISTAGSFPWKPAEGWNSEKRQPLPFRLRLCILIKGEQSFYLAWFLQLFFSMASWLWLIKKLLEQNSLLKIRNQEPDKNLVWMHLRWSPYAKGVHLTVGPFLG